MTSSSAALAFSGLLLLLGFFQVALAAGAPLGLFAWGGSHRVLPPPLRIGSLASLLLYATMAVVILSKAAVIHILPEGVATPGAWVVSAHCIMATVLNALSRSKPERSAMVPLSASLSVFSVWVALDI